MKEVVMPVGHRQRNCRAITVVWGCRFNAAPDLAMLVVASRQLSQALA